MDAILYMLEQQRVGTTVSETDQNPWMDEDNDTPGQAYVAEFFHPEGMRWTGYWWQGRGIKKPPSAAQIMRQCFEDLVDLHNYSDWKDWAENLGFEGQAGEKRAKKIWENLEMIKGQLQDFWGMTGFNQIEDNLEEGLGDDDHLLLEDGDEDEIMVQAQQLLPDVIPDLNSRTVPLYYKTKRRKIPGKGYGYKRDCTLVVHYGFDVEFAIKCDQAPHFSVTIEILPPGWFEGRDIVGGGADHETVAKYYPNLAKIIRWHLVAWPNNPMHYVANGRFWLEKLLGISQYKTETYENPERAFRSTVLMGIHDSDEAFLQRMKDEFGGEYHSEVTKKLVREKVAPLVQKWCELRRDLIEQSFYADMQEFGLINNDVLDTSPWIPDGRYYYPCFGYTTDEDHDSENPGLMKPYVRVFSEDQGYNDAANTDPKVSDGFTKPKRTYMAALRAAERYAEIQHGKRALASG